MTDASSLMKSQERNLESNTVMWLDANIDSTEDNRRAKARLRQTINYLRTFDDADQCVECISLVRTENIFLIVSGSLGQTVVPLIHDTRHVQSIYVFCSNKEWHEKWVTKFRKVRGVYTDIKHICEALEEQVHISSNDMSGLISVLSSSNSNNEKQEASFMYFQLLIEILLEIDSSDESKQELIEQCSKQYEENEKELAYIEEFHKKYEPNRAIWWYTRECFLYRMLNKALRVQDIDILFKLRFFIKDLHNQLEQLHFKSLNVAKELTLYRGQGMVVEEFEKLKGNIGGFLSINYFLSTSQSRDVAVRFAQASRNQEGFEAILFEISIDIENCSKPFHNITKYSALPKESEVLFSLGTVFRIQSIRRSTSTGIWNVKLLLNGQEDQDLRHLTGQIRNEVQENSKLSSLGNLLWRMGEYDKAEHYYLMLIDKTSGEDPDIASYYNNIGLVYNAMGEYSKALDYYEKTLELKLKTLGPNHPSVATTYNNIGGVYNAMGDYSKALDYYEKTLELDLKTLGPNHPSVATTYNHMGFLYKNQKRYREAKKYFEMSLAIREKALPSTHPHVLSGQQQLAEVTSIYQSV
ncbi:unnamed protein product [Didymodactylos carnosus]|uniref:NAD(P)(+)--arginine ADP-ribosyltransferase n=1 Tax=Didymodactylos carnosus TaxID=1234261 RepID=A0A8S2EL13_9BILA|nr:unnamed protein product [Didymodactylos carnosus]CAF4001956.1 unnamed protein product [Didymodactylos carnosus]